jgi:glutamine synthetase
MNLQELSTGRVGFVEEHGLWNEEQREAATRLRRQLEESPPETIRVGFSDLNGLLRGKTLTPSAFLGALRNGLDCSSGPYFFDTGHDLVSDPFASGGGLGLDELRGASDFVLVPDPLTFRILPWTDRPTGWILADEHLKSGAPVPFSARALLKRLLVETSTRGYDLVAGIEIEWYLTKLIDPQLMVESIGGFGAPGEPPLVAPVNLGYQFNSEILGDELEGILGEIRRVLLELDLPLRTIEHESGPGQIETTFEPQLGLEAADTALMLRNAVKQVCARRGYHATFMCCPGLNGFDASGWHLHQSLFTPNGQNAFASEDPDGLLSELGLHYVAGLLEHAAAASVMTTPTINGYKRLDPHFSLSPDRICWSGDDRGTYLRFLGLPGDASSHIENRIGEPSANPYLYLASQLISGLDGVDRRLDPGPPATDPHSASLPPAPRSLQEAVAALKADAVFRERAGTQLVDHLILVKENEIRRYDDSLDGAAHEHLGNVTEWEQREYFRSL